MESNISSADIARIEEALEFFPAVAVDADENQTPVQPNIIGGILSKITDGTFLVSEVAEALKCKKADVYAVLSVVNARVTGINTHMHGSEITLLKNRT